MTSSPESTEAYAKFVDADVLKVVCVFTPSSLNSGNGNFWRFLSSMSSLDFASFSFVIGGATQNVTSAYSDYTVYGVSTTFKPSDFSTASAYVMTYGAVDSTSTTTFSVNASWVTLDGTYVTGASYTFDASDAASGGSAVILVGCIS